MQAIIIMAAFLKFMTFLKVDSGFGLLVDSVSQCIIDCIPFTTFLCAWMGLFCLLYRIMGMRIDDGDYGTLNSIATYGIQTYRNTVGDDAVPLLPFWDKQTKNPYIGKFMCFMIWFTWLFNSFLLMLILLNFLIAILSASFEDMQNKAVQFEYKAKCQMNVDTMLIQKVLGLLTPFESITLTCNCSLERSVDPLDKAIENLKSS